MNNKLTIPKIEQRLKLIGSLVYRRRIELAPFCYISLEIAQADFSGIPDNFPGETIQPNTYWATWQQNFILRSNFCIPSEWDANANVALFLPIGTANDFSHPEALVIVDRIPLAGCDRHHQEILLPKHYLDGKFHTLILQGWTGMQRWDGSEPGTRLFMRPCELVQIDQPTRDFLATARVALDVAKNTDTDNPTYWNLLNALDSAFNRLDLTEPFGSTFYETIPDIYKDLQSEIQGAGTSLDAHIFAIAQSHIDLAWLWTLSQTRLKAGRTFHTVLHLMDQYPEMVYTQSQPQLYEYVQQDYPQLFTDIQREVANGRWEILGGMWVEPDCNLSGAEALARQFLLGRTYFQENFGSEAESPVLWLPDTFGFPSSLPQLMAQAGIRYFLTIKMGWNQTNRLPYDSFWWQGLDGTKVLTHFASNECNVFLSSENVLNAWKKYPQKGTYREIAILYGWGDGGGGPTCEMLENQREMDHFPALPEVRAGKAKDFFERLEKSSAKLPCWNGELYLEKHRGTYTTHSDIKRANRKSEFLLHDAEFLASTASLLDSAYSYPKDALRKAWKLVCLNQFHDILPGSSIGDVYADARQYYGAIEQSGTQICQQALASISAQIGGDLVIANPIGFKRNDLTYLPNHLADESSLQHLDGTPIGVQITPEGTLLAVGELPPYSITPLLITDSLPSQPETTLSATTHSLENDFLQVEFNSSGEITRLYDKTCSRDVLPENKVGNQLQAYEDRPVDSDAWDIDSFYEDKPLALSGNAMVRVIENGPLRAMVEIKRQFLHSQVIQRISLSYNSSRIDFNTYVDWHERHVLLKVAFPLDILSPAATYEIQWGSIQRPTHRNTSWEQAQFEVCAQKWVDLSEGGFGVSLLNDCKYGHDVHENVLRLSLLRGSTSPDPEADQGEHHFIYSLLPHKGNWEIETYAQAYALNDPLIVFLQEKCPTPKQFCLISSDADNVIIETIKIAEDGNGLIVRLYESHQKRGTVLLKAGFRLAQVWQTSLLEQNLTPVENYAEYIKLQIHPFEIITLRLVPAT